MPAIIHFSIVTFQHYINHLLRCCEYLETYLLFTFRFYVHQQIFACILHHSQFTVRQEVLYEALFFVRLQPCKVRLVLGIDTSHQFDVRSVLVSQITVPCTAEITVSPCPLLFARRNMMICHMKHTCTSVVFVATLKVVTGVDSHIRSRNFDILIVRNVYSGRIVHLIISTRCYREAGYGTLSMIEHRIDVGRKYTLIVVVHRYGRIRPPQEGLRHFGTVVEHPFYFEKSMSRTKREARHPFLMKHPFHFVHPYSDAAVSIFFNRRIYRHISTGTMMLRPIKLNTSRNPRTCQPHQCRFNHVIVINKMTFPDLIISHLYTTA